VKLHGASVHLAHVVVALLIVTYIAIFGTLSLRRHQNLRTNALDLGYTDQAVWNTLHGRPFRFSTYLDADFDLDIPIQDFQQPDVLLGYHVEPILAPISLLYLLHDGPETLLWLQTVALALGAIPVYLLARHRYAAPNRKHLASWLPVAFVVVYLLSPSLEAANLSDFHAVALSPVLLLSAFYCLENDRPWGFVAFAFLAAITKEEVGLLIGMVGLWAAVVRRRRMLGLGVAAAGLGWSLLCFTVIMPYFSGLGHSAFWVRYGQFGESAADVVLNLFRQPGLFVDWLRRPEVARYLRDMWLSSGGLAILYPPVLLLALPSLAINTFSSFDWMRSGGGHYSATIVPILVIAAIYGVAWAADRVGNWKFGKLSSGTRFVTTSLLLVGLGLSVALVHHNHAGISPLSRRYALEPVSEHARRAEPMIERVNGLPPDVSISVGSNLYPHVAHRERVYLFPTVSDARFILLDVTGPASPIGTGGQRQIVRELLEYGQFGITASDHGFLLLERDLDEYRLSPTFHQVFLAGDSIPQMPVGADFAGLLRLEGFDRTVRPVVRVESVVEIVTYWRALAPLEREYRLVFFFWDEQGHLLRIQPEEQALHWYPTWYWEPGQLIKVALPPLPVGDMAHVGVALLLPGAGDREIEGRLMPIRSSGGQPLSLWEQDTIVELTEP